jgi:predicted N-acetyltransferase YhbS
MLEMIKIRTANPGDAPAIAAVHNNAWRRAYRGIVPDDHLDGLNDQRAADQWKAILEVQQARGQFHLVAEGGDGKIFGFSGGGPRRQGPRTYGGELYAIYVDPQAQGRGVGSDLFLESCRRLKQQGHKAMLVWALRKAGNARFYEKHGGKAVDLQQVEIGVTLEEVCWGWDGLEQLILTLEAA